MAAIGGNIVVSTCDDIFVSADGGASWTNNTNGYTMPIDEIYTSGENLVAFGVNGIIVSKDKGWTWSQKSGGYCMSMIAFGDTLISQSGLQSSDEALLRSTDNGNHWYSIPVEIKPSGYLTKAIRTHNGILAGTNGGLTRTTDGGITWWNEPAPFVGRVEALEKNGNIVFAVTGSGVYRSTNDGDSWDKSPCLATQNGAEEFYGGGACGSGFYVCAYSDVYYSKDSGKVWTKINTSNCAARKVFYLNGKLFLCTDIGLYEINQENNSITLNSSGLNNIDILSLVSTPRRTLAFAAENIYYTTNSGRNWTEMPEASTIKYVTHTVSKGSIIIASCYDGHAFRSENDGDTWTEIVPWVGYNPYTVKDLSSNGEYTYITANGNVYYSTDWGVSWHGMLNPIGDFIMPIGGTGRGGEFVVLDNYYDIHSTSDFGETWTLRDAWGTDSPGIVRAFGDELYIGNYNGQVEISTNFGTDWKESNCGHSFGIDISGGMKKFGNTLYAFSYYGGLTFSTDRGDSWTPDMNGVKQNTVRCFEFDGTTAYLGTGSGGVYCTNFGNVSAETPSIEPSDLSVWPNPARDFVSVASPKPNSAYRIVNALGETVAAAQSSSGEAMRIDVSSLAPGVYFVVSGSQIAKFVKF